MKILADLVEAYVNPYNVPQGCGDGQAPRRSAEAPECRRPRHQARSLEPNTRMTGWLSIPSRPSTIVMVTTDTRASEAEREHVIDHLKHAFAEGRLEDAELDVRVGLALTAKTRHELEWLLADLPAILAWATIVRAAAPGDPNRGLPVLATAGRAAERSAGVPPSRRPRREQHAQPMRSAGRTVLILLLATFGTAVIAYLSAAAIAAAMSLHLIE